jgi:hypothetical protein
MTGMSTLVETFVLLYKHKESWDDMLFWTDKGLQVIRG